MLTFNQIKNLKSVPQDYLLSYDDFIQICANHPSVSWTDIRIDDFMKWRDAVEDNTTILPNCVTGRRLLFEIKHLALLVGAEEAKEGIIQAYKDQ